MNRELTTYAKSLILFHLYVRLYIKVINKLQEKKVKNILKAGGQIFIYMESIKNFYAKYFNSKLVDNFFEELPKDSKKQFIIIETANKKLSEIKNEIKRTLRTLAYELISYLEKNNIPPDEDKAILENLKGYIEADVAVAVGSPETQLYFSH